MRTLSCIGLVMAVGLAVAGCSRGDVPGTDASARTADSEASPAGGLRVEGTPPGGLESWLSEIRSGMPTDGSAMKSQWQVLHRQLLELYVGRQEYVEMYWGPNGRLQGEGGLALGQAVLDLETAFHEVLQGIVAVPLDTTVVLSAAAKVKREADMVWAAAEVSGLSLEPPSDTTPAAAR